MSAFAPQDLEKALDVFNIVLARQQAQTEVGRSPLPPPGSFYKDFKMVNLSELYTPALEMAVLTINRNTSRAGYMVSKTV